MTLCFSFAYCQTLSKCVVQLHLPTSQQSIVDIVEAFGIVRKLSIAWKLVVREMHLLYQCSREKNCRMTKCRLKIFLPKAVIILIGTAYLVYCTLKNKGYGMQRFAKEMHEKIALLPRDEACEDLVSAHKHISEKMQRMLDNSWTMMNAEFDPQNMKNESERYGDGYRYFESLLRSKSGSRCIINFLRETQCAYCSKRKRRLRVCRSCRTARYCSRLCQKKHWIVHKGTCTCAVSSCSFASAL